MGASKWVQIQRTEPHRLLAIHSPAFYVAHHSVRPTACWQTHTTLTTIDCTQFFYHCCIYEVAQHLLKLTNKTDNTFLAFSHLLSLSPLSFLPLHYVQTFHSSSSSTPLWDLHLNFLSTFLLYPCPTSFFMFYPHTSPPSFKHLFLTLPQCSVSVALKWRTATAGGKRCNFGEGSISREC